jgi:hypothetical protein
MNDFQEEKKEAAVLNIRIPKCCIEGWDSCTHTVKPFKKKKTNIAL